MDQGLKPDQQQDPRRESDQGAKTVRKRSTDRDINFSDLSQTSSEKNMSSYFQKWIENSLKIDDGPPARYQLQLKRVNRDTETDEEPKLRRFTLGEPDYRYVNRTVLLVGATGSGKSTMINVMVNFVMGVKFEDKIWFEVIEDEKSGRSAESPTSTVSVYEIFGFEGKVVPYSLTIIDTPGFGDTKGIENDDLISNKLQDLLRVSEGVDTISAVGLVIKATDNRLDERTAYILNSVTSLFGKHMEQNIVVMITHCDRGKPTDALHFLDEAKVKCARDTNGEAVHFCFKNSQKERIEDDDEEKEAERAFTDSKNGMAKFTDFLGQRKPLSVKSTLEVMRERVQLTACIQNVRKRLTTIEEKQEIIKKNRAELEKQGKLVIENEIILIEVEETYKEKEVIDDWWDDKATTCNKCKENCHYPGCTLAWSPRSCEVMKNGKCTSCTGKCDVRDHVKKKWKYVDKTRKVIKPVTDLTNLEKEMFDLQQKKDQCLDEAFQHIEKLEKIALNVDSVSTIVHLDFLIEKMKEKGDTEKMQKLEEMKGRISESNQAAGNYVKGRIQSGLKKIALSK